jgi:4-aminobutyrate aminotransferase-like enzyme
VLALPAGGNVLRLLPSLTLTEEEADIAVAAIAEVLGD